MTETDPHEMRAQLMPLDVSPDLLAAAERGEIADAQFAAYVRTSLPYAWELVGSLSTRLHLEGGPFADNTVPPADEQERAQLLHALASDAVRGCLERCFEVKLAFQNAQRLAAFPAADGQPGMESGAYRRFVSPRAQLLNLAAQLHES